MSLPTRSLPAGLSPVVSVQPQLPSASLSHQQHVTPESLAAALATMAGLPATAPPFSSQPTMLGPPGVKQEEATANVAGWSDAMGSAGRLSGGLEAGKGTIRGDIGETVKRLGVLHEALSVLRQVGAWGPGDTGVGARAVPLAYVMPKLMGGRRVGGWMDEWMIGWIDTIVFLLPWLELSPFYGGRCHTSNVYYNRPGISHPVDVSVAKRVECVDYR